VVQKGKKNSMPGKPASSRGKALKGKVSVVIPVEPGGSVLAALKALKALPKAEKALICEVLVAEGRNPSRQRNLAVAQAKGEFIHFLDSDSRLESGALPALMRTANALKAVAVGGPNLALQDEPFWGRVFQAVQASWLGSMSSRARYTPVGESRLSGEKELILCNLLFDRQVFSKTAGFREDLYPNEENELFNRLQAQGLGLAYEPGAIVRRPRRPGPTAFAQQAFRYGRGRMQQMRANFFLSDLVNLLPLLLIPYWAMFFWFPRNMAIITAILFIQVAFIGGPSKGGWRTWVSQLYPFMLALRHHAYAVGLLVGLFQRPPQRSKDVKVARTPWLHR
jgi:GT2 family glycosyltransferase